MNVLYISYDGLTDPLGQSQVLPYLEGIAKAGHKIVILSFEKPTRYNSTKQIIEARCAAANIIWQPQMYTKKPPVFSTVYDVNKMMREAKRLHKQYKFDLVHCRSYIPAMAGVMLKKKFNVMFLFDMRGFWADERVEGGLWNLQNRLYKTIYNYFKKREREFIHQADGIISLTQNAADYLKESFDKIVSIDVIPCCADLDMFNRKTIDVSKLKALREQLNISENDFVLTYVGSLGTWYMLDEMLDFFKTLLSKKSNSKFLVITNDPSARIHQAASARNISESKIVVTTSPRNEMPLYTALANATLFFIKPTFSKRASSPVKQGEAMGMGIPIVCNAGIGDTDVIVNESHAGIVIDGFDETQYIQAVDKLLNTSFDANEIRRGAEKFYSLKEGIAKYLRVYEKLQRG